MQATRFADAQTAYPDPDEQLDTPGYAFPSMTLEEMRATHWPHFNLWLDCTGIQNRFVITYRNAMDYQIAVVGLCEESIQAYGERTSPLCLGRARGEAVGMMRDELLGSERPWPIARFFRAEVGDLELETMEQIEACKREIHHYARFMGLDYQSDDIKSFSYPQWGTAVFLTRYNPAWAIEWVRGVPVPVLDTNGVPVIEYQYPLYIETTPRPPNANQTHHVTRIAVGVRVVVRIPQLVFIIFPDGTVQAGDESGAFLVGVTKHELHERIEESIRDVRAAIHANLGGYFRAERNQDDLDPNLQGRAL